MSSSSSSSSSFLLFFYFNVAHITAVLVVTCKAYLFVKTPRLAEAARGILYYQTGFVAGKLLMCAGCVLEKESIPQTQDLLQ